MRVLFNVAVRVVTPSENIKAVVVLHVNFRNTLCFQIASNRRNLQSNIEIQNILMGVVILLHKKCFDKTALL